MVLTAIVHYSSCKLIFADVVFSDFGEKCSKRSYMFMTNQLSGDFQHPIRTKGILMNNVDAGSVAYFHRPDVG